MNLECTFLSDAPKFYKKVYNHIQSSFLFYIIDEKYNKIAKIDIVTNNDEYVRNLSLHKPLNIQYLLSNKFWVVKSKPIAFDWITFIDKFKIIYLFKG